MKLLEIMQSRVRYATLDEIQAGQDRGQFEIGSSGVAANYHEDGSHDELLRGKDSTTDQPLEAWVVVYPDGFYDRYTEEEARQYFKWTGQ